VFSSNNTAKTCVKVEVPAAVNRDVAIVVPVGSSINLNIPLPVLFIPKD